MWKLDDSIHTSSVKSYGGLSFYGCLSLNSVFINSTTTGRHTFFMCQLKTVVLGSNVKIISYGTFQDAGGLKSVVLHEGITTIEEYAFSGTGMDVPVLPSTLVSIEAYTHSTDTAKECGNYINQFT